MRGGGDKIREHTERLTIGLGLDDQHVAVVTWRVFERNAGQDFGVLFDERHAAGDDERVVIVTDVADRVAGVPLVGVFVFGRACEVLSFRESGFARDHVAAAMVPVEVGVDDRIDAVGGEESGKRSKCGQVHAFPLGRGELVAAAGFDQDCVGGRFDDVAIEGERDPVVLIGRGMALPKRFGDDAEDSAAIPPVMACADQRDAELA